MISFIKNKRVKIHAILHLCRLTLIIGLFATLISTAQTKDDLEKKKKDIEKNIQYTNSLLEETKKNKEASLNQLTTLKNKIILRQNLVNLINNEIKLIDKQINENNNTIKALEKDLGVIKEQYAKMIYYGYKNRNSYTRLTFIFSSKDFNQAQKRLKYLQQYSEYRQDQAELIVKTKKLINEKNESLENKKEKKRNLLRDKERERQALASEKAEKKVVYEKLQKKEVQLKDDLVAKHNEAIKLQKAIEDIIAEEIRKAREREKEIKGFTLTPEETQLSESFNNNKGKLPWPVKRGIITGQFGEHDHPVLQGIKINNNGIDLSTNKGANARAIFDGVVTGVIILPGANNKAVIVRHGEYFSVYGNLQDVYVKKGDKVVTKQDIGLIYTDNQKFKTEGHLEIWKLTPEGTVKLNPEKWIAAKNKSE